MELERSRSSLEEKFLELCTKVVEENGMRVYELDYLSGQSSLRLYIMNPESKTAVIEDCIKIDRALTPYIDQESWMPQELTLEVSSPGLFRDLRQAWHFNISSGERIQVLLKKILGDINENFQEKLPKKIWKSKKVTGHLVKLDGEDIVASFDNIEVHIPLEHIKKVNLEPEF